MAKIFIYLMPFIILVSGQTVCNLLSPGDNYIHTLNNGNIEFVVNFNYSINQPNYVYYLTKPSGQSCNNCNITECPYQCTGSYSCGTCTSNNFRCVNYSPIRTTDYTNSQYERGHLVPRTEYGLSLIHI